MVWANLSAARDYYPRRLPHDTEEAQVKLIVKSGETIYKGSIVEYETGATGYVVPGADQDALAGVAAETVVGDGTLTITLWTKGEHYFAKTTPAITDVGKEVYCTADVDPGTVDASGTNKVGRVTDYDASGLWVRIDNYAS